MVYGIDKFKQYFGEYTGQYVFIGGTACFILLNDIGLDFRATKDLDMVLIIEAINEEFGTTFWKFIQDGGYEHKQKSAGEEQFYRFSNPSEPGFPSMIELFSRKSKNFKFEFETGMTPIHLSESVASLSAILLNDSYYDLLIQGKTIVDGYSVLSIEYILLFKVKAWLDLLERKENNEHIDSRDINKHKNDIFRLVINIVPSIKVSISDEIQNDITTFLKRITKESIDLKNLGIRAVSLDDILNIIKKTYGSIS
jgi:hypothetical protein